MPENRRAIIVAGLHRSGTSAVARIVNLLGADLAPDLIPPGIGNELGHWESRAVQDLNNGMLAELRSDIYSPVNFPQSWFDGPSAQTWIDRIEALVREEYFSNFFVLKDPRIVLFVPLWISALRRLAIEPCFIIPFRNPVAVAVSLDARERRLDSGRALPLSQGVALWLRCMLAVERYTRGQRRSFVSFDKLLADWRSELTRIGHQLAVGWPRLGAADAEIDRFLDSGHRDLAPTAPADDRSHILQLAAAVYDSLDRTLADPQMSPGIFDTAAEMIAAAERILGAYVLAKENEVAALRDEIAATTDRRAADNAHAHRSFDAEIQARDARLADAAAYAQSLERSRDEALDFARSQEARANEFGRALETARLYALSLAESRDEALDFARSQEARANELDRALETARLYALSLAESRDEALRYAKAEEPRAAGPAKSASR
jgi:hypothetical protein